MSNSIVLSANYLPPVSYFHVIAQQDSPIVIDGYEHFIKQTYRSRTAIGTASGTLDLIIPVQHGRRERVAMKDVRINADHDWQRLHWKSIQTAYRGSAYFEYYEDDFADFYDKKFDFLFDFNVQQLELVLKLLKLKPTVLFSDRYVAVENDTMDFRTLIHPKKPSLYAAPKPYYQVFEERMGFMPNLSIVDLIFNQGPQSKNYL